MEDGEFMSEHIGPTLWHGREINACTRCKYLRCRLTKSGRHPDYEYFCMHPSALDGSQVADRDRAILDKIKERFPGKLEYFTNSVAKQRADVAANGEFICNDETTPETPHWCPAVAEKKAQ